MARRALRTVVRNTEELYEELRRKRGVKHIDHFPTPKMRHPQAEDLIHMSFINHVWKVGDRYSKLAHKHYGDATYWWVIAWYNRLPTDSHVSIGDVIIVPTSLDDALENLEY